jgi:O-antigen ligase
LDSTQTVPRSAFTADLRLALQVALSVLLPAAVFLYFAGELGLYAGIALFAAGAVFLNREGRVALLLLLLPVSSFQIAEGWAVYRLYDTLFVLVFVLRLLVIDGLHWARVPVLGWLVVMGLAFLPSFLNAPLIETSLSAMSQLVLCGLTAWGVFYYVSGSNRPKFAVALARMFLYEGGLVATFGLTQSLRSSSLSTLASGRGFVGFFGDPNYYAVYLVILVSIGIGFAFYEETMWRRLLAGGITLVSVVGVFASVSRAGILIMLAVVFASIAFIVVTMKGSGKVIAAVVILLLFVGSGVVLFTPLGSKIVDIVVLTDRVSNALSGKDVSVDQRSNIFIVTWRAVEKHPIIGIGFGSIEEAFDEYREAMLSTGSGRSVHNTGYRILAETGVVGLLPSLLFVLALSLHLWRAQKQAPGLRERFLLFGFFLALASYFGTSMTLDQLLSYLFWPLCGLALAVAAKMAPAGDSQLLPSEPLA